LYRWKEPSCPQAILYVSRCLLASGERASYRGGDGTIVRRGALGGEVDAIGSLELDLKSGYGGVSGSALSSMGSSDQRRCGRSPC
jgi:hypothetical protein